MPKQLIKVGAGWKAKSGKGYNCSLSQDVPKETRLYISKNKYKEKDEHPDILLGYFAEEEEQKQPPDDDVPF